VALNGPEKHVTQACEVYRKRRDALCDGLNQIGWDVQKPLATMFVWAKLPEKFQKMGSNAFSKHLLREASVMISPGVGFGEYGEGYVRFALVENEKRIHQAVRSIKKVISRG
jgi:alanine-synthesizing transaminase